MRRVLIVFWAKLTEPFQWLYHTLRLNRVFDILEGTDVDGTIRTIQNGIQLKGSEMWILMASALLASIGLDTNSPAVIIGAMLISPLMSPILGVGLGVGINHRQLLWKAGRLFTIYTVVAIGVSWLYFLITPLGDATAEMQARTRPTLLDVGVAVFGGVAGIIANSRAEKSNAIPGVAIATALMPPLCTSAFGLATGQWNFFLGAFYLFFLNSVFIALSTYVVVQVLQFPHVEFRDRKQAKTWNWWIIGIVVSVLIPAGVLFFVLIQEVNLNRSINRFVQEHIHTEYREVFNREVIEADTLKEVKLFVIGTPIPQDSIPAVKAEWKRDERRAAYRLELIQTDLPLDAQDRLRAEIMKNVQQALDINRQLEEERARQERAELRRTGGDFDFIQLQAEIHAQYPEVAEVAYARAYSANYDAKEVRLDTLPIFVVHWEPKLARRRREELTTRLEEWLKIRTNYEGVRLVNVSGGAPKR